MTWNRRHRNPIARRGRCHTSDRDFRFRLNGWMNGSETKCSVYTRTYFFVNSNKRETRETLCGRNVDAPTESCSVGNASHNVTRQTLNQCNCGPKAAVRRNSADFPMRTKTVAVGAAFTHSHNVIIDDKPKVVIIAAVGQIYKCSNRVFCTCNFFYSFRRTYFLL